MLAPDLISLHRPEHAMPQVWPETFQLWLTRRRMQRIERLAVRQLAYVSSHIRADIGVPAQERGQNACLRLWRGGAT